MAMEQPLLMDDLTIKTKAFGWIFHYHLRLPEVSLPRVTALWPEGKSVVDDLLHGNQV
jgi:hypothetical protein